jgi:plastocyanin
MKYRTTTSNIVVIALAIAVGFISLGLISYATAQTTHENNVTIPAGASMKPENGFVPKAINVKAGQIVTWNNMDNSLHTVISGRG